ncbi:catalase [Coemansia reversa NRRL 1564]|uniref:Catalase n=1 Tax=Coemansia reversa (strain ATCC 12441 / NRRL 1564) TaxID=763665 RepID=A0A2G5BDJ7_COERN|nr:catalase [Coemansia reversa NRRL 1564]|eukprot:PIA17090.1 catalase [Coemansia reversa NRRL 1564]
MLQHPSDAPTVDSRGVLTTANGNPVDNNQTSLTAGEYGPVVLQDFHLIDKLAHFDRERIPERVVHAKGAGAHGYFEVTKDISHLTCAKFLNKVGKRTPVFTRFSTVGGELGSGDTARDPRGFSVKFYTEEGNWDMVGNNTPIFFIRDPVKFPDFIHTQKRHPQTHLPDPTMVWDFWSLVPESLHQVTILMSDRGIPDGFRHMHGYSSHALKLVAKDGSYKYVKWHFRTEQGIKNILPDEATRLAGTDPNYATRDLFNAIERGEHPAWKVYVQVIEPEQALKYRFNPFDVTKVVSQKDFPLQEVGRMVLNRNPENYFAEVEQAAFCPSHMVPGIAPSPDRMLQGRLFSYADTHRHRLGPNYHQIPINRPISGVNNQQRDGAMAINGNGGATPNYEPNSFGGPAQNNLPAQTHAKNFIAQGEVARHTYEVTDDDFAQVKDLYNLFTVEQKDRLASVIASTLSQTPAFIQKRQLQHFYRADKDYGRRVEAALKAAGSKI